MYTPQFVNDAILDGTGKVVGWAPPQLTEASAQQLAALFPQYVAGVEMREPEAVGAAFWLQSKGPWLIYTNGTAEDAYNVAQLFGHGWPFPQSLYYASLEIEGTMKGN